MKEALTERTPSGGICTASSPRLTHAVCAGMPVHFRLDYCSFGRPDQGTPYADGKSSSFFTQITTRGSELPATPSDTSENQPLLHVA